MADLVLDWGALGAYGYNLEDTASDGVTTSVDTGGVAVDITFTAQDAEAQAFTVNYDGYVPEGSEVDPNSHLKLFGEGGDGDGTVSSTSTTVLDFRATAETYTDNVQNVSFLLNDVDAGTGSDLGDLAEYANGGAGGGFSWEDNVTVLAYDAEGNPVEVTMTPLGTEATVTGDTATGTDTTSFAEQNGTVQVSIAGPVSRIEIVYENGGNTTQGVLVSDVNFATVDYDGDLPPVAVDDMASTPEDTAVIIDVLDNDSDPEGGDLTVTSATATNGTVDINDDGTLTYTPDADYNGPAEITYVIQDPAGNEATGTVDVTVDPVNDAPVAVDDTADTTEGEPVTLDPTSNDTDVDGDDLTVTEVSDPENGTATVNEDGTVTYTPDDGFTGDDTITYTVDDGNGGTDTGEIVVTVDDGVSPPPPVNTDPVAVDDTAETTEGEPVTFDPAANDTDADGDDLTVTEVSDPENGTATLNDDGTVTYTPDDGFTGDDTITYIVDDGNGGTDTGEIVVTVDDGVSPPPPANTDPVAVDDTVETFPDTAVTFDPADNDTDADGDDLTVTAVGEPTNGTATLNDDGTVTYTPDDGFIGEDTIPYTVDDGNGGTDTGEIVVMVAEEDTDGRIDADIFPVSDDLQPLDPFDGLDEDPDPDDDRDSVVGLDTDDTISTGDDADTIIGDGGNDVIRPGIDNDYVEAGDGDDYVSDIQGADTIIGGAGNDTIIAGVDTFSDYEGDDPNLPILGFTSDPNQEDGRDYVEGNTGDDSIMTGDDRDTIDGGQGNDWIDGGIDDDFITGNVGDDTIYGGHGSDTIDGGQDNDYIDGSAPASLELTDDVDPVPENDRDSLMGGLGDDTLIGGDDDDTLIGGSGNDSLDGGIDEDSIIGGNGDDTIIGGQGADTIDGGNGRDMIIGADGGDVVDGGDGPAGVDENGDPYDYDTLDLTGSAPEGGSIRVVYTSDDREDGYVEFFGEDRTEDSDPLSTMTFEEIENVVPCFTPGTLIATPQGERLVEDLKVGDRVITRDNGIQEIKWLGQKELTGFDLARKPHMKPILIQKGALGNNLPEHDLLVSPNHRILVANDKTALYFEEREVLASAKHLTGLEGVDEVGTLGVTYIHFMFDQHEVVLSNGAWSESFQPGDYTLKGIGDAQRQEIFELFPELEHAEGLQAYGAARRSLKKHEAQLLTK